MAYTVAQIATALGARAEGNVDLTIERAAEPGSASPDSLALAMDVKYAEGLRQGAARAAILWEGADWQELGLEAAIFVPRARYAMSGLTSLMDPGPEIAPGIHPSAVIDPTATIGVGAAIGPLVVVGPRARIGANVRIAPQVTVAEDVVIGDDALLHSGVRIGARVRIGNGFIANPGAVVGSDGFSFVTPEKSTAEAAREAMGEVRDIKAQSWTRIHSLGSVVLGDRVEVGANSTIDRGTIRDTTIGDGTKVDNLVQVGHNCEIGQDCLLCGLAGLAGSVKVGNRVVLAGQVGVVDNIFIGDDVVAGGGSKLLANVPAGRVMLGYPAVKMENHVESYKALRRLPRLFKQVAALQKAVSKTDTTT